MKKKFKFIEAKPVVKQIVGVTCETCAVKNCLERASPPTQLENKKRHENTDLVVQQYIAKYS
jgi:predicted transcriptional regulator